MCKSGNEDSQIDYLLASIDRLNSRVVALEDDVRKLQNKPEARPKGRQAIETFDPDMVSFVKNLKAKWPKVRKDGGAVHSDAVDTCVNLKHILKNYDTSLAELGACAELWLATNPPYPNAMQFFFGRGRGDEQPRWLTELEAMKTKKALEEK